MTNKIVMVRILTKKNELNALTLTLHYSLNGLQGKKIKFCKVVE